MGDLAEIWLTGFGKILLFGGGGGGGNLILGSIVSEFYLFYLILFKVNYFLSGAVTLWMPNHLVQAEVTEII